MGSLLYRLCLFGVCFQLFSVSGNRPYEFNDGNIIRKNLSKLIDGGKFSEIVHYLGLVEKSHGHLNFDDFLPSLYNFRGVAYHELHQLELAVDSFRKAVSQIKCDTRSWINLGETLTHLFRLNEAIGAFESALRCGDRTALSALMKAKGWSSSWKNFEYFSTELERAALRCTIMPENCSLDSQSGLEYTNTPGVVSLHMLKFSPMSKPSNFLLPVSMRASVSDGILPADRVGSPVNRLRIGLISSDWGIHPVATLLRGLIQYIDTNRIELFCFSLVNEVSWWGGNISRTAEHFIVLPQGDTQAAAAEIGATKIQILIDLNGFTLHSGLPIMSHRPAPIQMSYLGFPVSTAASFIDYYIADWAALPAELSDHFSEKLLLLPPCYIANDYAQIQGSVLDHTGALRAPRSSIVADHDLDDVPPGFLFATLSNSQKTDPQIFHVWMNILRRFPASKLVMINYRGSEEAMKNMRFEARAQGVYPARIPLAEQSPWIHHLYHKTAFDLILDTSSKNGHTTGLDAIWAGVPTISTGGGSSMPARAAESIASGFGSDAGITYSLKEYEDLAFAVASDQRKLAYWREFVERQRKASTLFNVKRWSKEFVRIFQAAWEMSRITPQPYHIFTSKMSGSAEILETHQVGADGDEHKDDTVSPFTNLSYKSIRAKSGKDVLFPVFSRDQKSSHNIRRKLLSHLQDNFSRNSDSPISESDNLASSPSTDIETSPSARLPSDESSQKNNKQTSHSSIIGEDDPLPSAWLSPDYNLFLNIGGIERVAGWLNVNNKAVGYEGSEEYAGHIDIVRPMHDLRMFPNESVAAIYSSHTLEHASLSFGDDTVPVTLREWRRVLKPGGLLMISVPDIVTLARMMIDPKLTVDEKYIVTKMIFGAQTDIHDFHKVGFYHELLVTLLSEANFCDIERVGALNILDDSSTIRYAGYFISLNVIARPCTNYTNPHYHGFWVDHFASKYDPSVL